MAGMQTIIVQQNIFFSPVTVYVPAKHLKQPPSQFVGYKERDPKAYKGFVVLQSDRDPIGEVYCDRGIC